jgi:hypothetical protein
VNQVIPSIVEETVTNKFSSVEAERVKTFINKQATESPSFKFEQIYDPEKDQVFLQYANANISHSTLNINSKVQSSLCAALGTTSNTYSHLALSQVVNAQFVSKDDGARKANATIEALTSMAPQDIVEGQLCSRLIILQDQYNEYMRRAALPNQPLEIIERYINCATKLMRVYNDTLDTLNKYRRKGEQKVTVQHVNINGGQAVVAGQLNQAGGGDIQKGKGVPHVS